MLESAKAQETNYGALASTGGSALLIVGLLVLGLLLGCDAEAPYGTSPRDEHYTAVHQHHEEKQVRMVQMGGQWSAFEGASPEPGSYKLPPIRPAADGEVILSNGERSTLHRVFNGNVTLLSFIFTRCPDACPKATGVLHRIHQEIKKDPNLATQLRLVSLSFDPEYDTPERMAQYSMIADGGGNGWWFLTTQSEQSIVPLLEAYDQHVMKEHDADGNFTGNFSHILRVYLIDSQKRVRNIYSTSYLYPELLLADIRTLILDEKNNRKIVKGIPVQKVDDQSSLF